MIASASPLLAKASNPALILLEPLALCLLNDNRSLLSLSFVGVVGVLVGEDDSGVVLLADVVDVDGLEIEIPLNRLPLAAMLMDDLLGVTGDTLALLLLPLVSTATLS